MSPGIENGNEVKTVLGYQRHIGRNESERIDSSVLSTSEMKKPEQLSCSGFMFGGSVEIRTLEPFRVAGFQDRCLQPLGHASNEAHYKHPERSCKAPIRSFA